MEITMTKILMIMWYTVVEHHAMICAEVETMFQKNAYRAKRPDVAEEHSKNVAHYHMMAATASQNKRLLRSAK